MSEENQESKCHYRKSRGGSGMAGAAYFMGFIAAAVYFIQNAAGFWFGVLGFLKALVWPGFLVYYLFDFLKL